MNSHSPVEPVTERTALRPERHRKCRSRPRVAGFWRIKNCHAKRSLLRLAGSNSQFPLATIDDVHNERKSSRKGNLPEQRREKPSGRYERRTATCGSQMRQLYRYGGQDNGTMSQFPRPFHSISPDAPFGDDCSTAHATANSRCTSRPGGLLAQLSSYVRI